MDWLSPVEDLAGFAFPILERVPVIRAILGFILVFFLPGFSWTLLFFRQINILERVALSLAMSIAIVTLSLFIVNFLFKVPLTGLNTVLIILFLIILPVFLYYLNKFVRRRRNGAVIDSEPGV